MSIIFDLKTYTASEAREKLYTLIRAVGSSGLKAFEITLRGSEPVVLVNKAELESWQETFDILINKKEIAGIRRARKQKKTISHSKMLSALGLTNAT